MIDAHPKLAIARNRIAALEAELAAMRAERDGLQMQYGIVVQTLYDIAEIVEADKQRADGDELIANAKAAQADSRRLDWLDKYYELKITTTTIAGAAMKHIESAGLYASGGDLRDTIDAAMTGQKEPPRG